MPPRPTLGGVDQVFGTYCVGYFTWMNPTDQLWLLVQGSHPIAANLLRPHLTAFQVREIGNVLAAATPYGSGCGGLALAASARPIANNAISLVSSGITPTSLFGAVAFGLTAYPTPLGAVSSNGLDLLIGDY